MGLPFALFALLKGLRGGLCGASLMLQCFAPNPSGLPFQSLTQSIGFQFNTITDLSSLKVQPNSYLK
ncbi:MAG: hypothetical protein NZ551_05695 [Microscillaceae bacterium]|nr:hypothetical protein [Microscillaceae bacterium]MDW8460690.1 hypothetical protein [Cytophagales bacterium]